MRNGMASQNTKRAPKWHSTGQSTPRMGQVPISKVAYVIYALDRCQSGGRRRTRKQSVALWRIGARISTRGSPDEVGKLRKAMSELAHASNIFAGIGARGGGQRRKGNRTPKPLQPGPPVFPPLALLSPPFPPLWILCRPAGYRCRSFPFFFFFFSSACYLLSLCTVVNV